MENKKQYCECPLCDNASEAGCMNEATILVPQSESCGSDYWLCPNCAGSVAVVSKIETGRAPSFEQLAELDKAAEKRAGVYHHCAQCREPLHGAEGYYLGGDPGSDEIWLCEDCNKVSEAQARIERFDYIKGGGDQARDLRHEEEARKAVGATANAPKEASVPDCESA
jgi:hypothetical protein